MCTRVTKVNVSVSPWAQQELIDGAAFYAERAGRELGLTFIAEFEHAALKRRRHIENGSRSP